MIKVQNDICTSWLFHLATNRRRPPSFVLFLRRCTLASRDSSRGLSRRCPCRRHRRRRQGTLHPRATRPNDSSHETVPSFPTRGISVSVIPAPAGIRAPSDRWRARTFPGDIGREKLARGERIWRTRVSAEPREIETPGTRAGERHERDPRRMQYIRGVKNVQRECRAVRENASVFDVFVFVVFHIRHGVRVSPRDSSYARRARFELFPHSRENLSTPVMRGTRRKFSERPGERVYTRDVNILLNRERTSYLLRHEASSRFAFIA